MPGTLLTANAFSSKSAPLSLRLCTVPSLFKSDNGTRKGQTIGSQGMDYSTSNDFSQDVVFADEDACLFQRAAGAKR